MTVETDYPHLDGTWPDSQEILWRQIGHLPRATAERTDRAPPLPRSVSVIGAWRFSISPIADCSR